MNRNYRVEAANWACKNAVTIAKNIFSISLDDHDLSNSNHNSDSISLLGSLLLRNKSKSPFGYPVTR